MIESILFLLLCFLMAYGLIALFFYFFQESLLFQSKPMPMEAHISLDRPFDELFLPMADGAVIHALHIKSPTPVRGIIIYFHGNAGNLERWGPVASDLTQYGYDVLVIDYRGYGKSTGKRSMQRLFADTLELYEWARERVSPDRIVIYGRSIGTAMASWLAARAEAQRLILETPFYRINDILAFRFLMLPAELMLRYPFRNDQQMNRMAMPVHIFHGTLDGVVPYFSGKKLYDAFHHRIPMELITIPGGRHNNLAEYPRFHAEIGRILGKPAIEKGEGASATST